MLQDLTGHDQISRHEIPYKVDLFWGFTTALYLMLSNGKANRTTVEKISCGCHLLQKKKRNQKKKAAA
jgi:hypothetical protein